MIKLFTFRLTAMAGALLWGVSPGWAQQANTQLTTTNSQVQDTIKNAQADQKTTTLQEVVVESASRKRIPQGIAFFPSKKEKNFATDAENLIQIMTLPELPYDYRNKVVTTASGLGVTYFIDGREASKKEINLINPKDVERIEYFPMPTSGDFVGKKNVVNYVMKKYLSGGYTRISAQQYLEGTYGNYYLASRLVHKKVTFDGYFDGGYINTKKSGTLTTNTYKDFTYNSTHYDRVEETLDGRDNKSRRNDMGAFIRAIWQHRALDLTTTIGWNWQQQPEVINRSATSYTPEIFNSNFVTTRSNSLNINPYARIVAKLKLPRKQTLTFNLVGISF